MNHNITTILIATINLLVFICLNSCSLYGRPQTPSVISMNVPTNFRNANKFVSLNPALSAAWWQNFHDVNLNQLIELSLHNNFSYQISLKNIQIAQTYISQNTSSLFPLINLNVGAIRNQIATNAATTAQSSATSRYNLYQLNGTVSYEIDFWNRIRNNIKQAEANFNASIASSNVAKLTLVSTIANTYWQVVTLNLNLINLKQQADVAKKIIQLTQDQYRSGIINIEPTINAKTQLENIKNSIANQEKQKAALQATLAYLAGEYPERFNLKLSDNLHQVNLTKTIPAGIPAQILTNRPDIQNSFCLILSFGYIQKQTLASFFPTFTLTGAYGFASLGLANLTAGNSLLWNFGANILEPLFDYKNRTSQYQRAKLQYEAAILSYKDAVINAFKEVNTALAAYQHDYLSLQTLQNTMILNQEKLGVAAAQYHSGVLDYATYLSYKLIYLQSKYNFINQKQAVILDIIQVYKTLGLGL